MTDLTNMTNEAQAEKNTVSAVVSPANPFGDSKEMLLKQKRRRKRRENLTGWLFVAPLTVGLCLFLLFPLVFAIVVSFTDYSMYSPYEFFEFKFNFVGFDNYIKAFQNKDFMRSLLNACINCIGVPIGIVISLGMTALLIQNKRGSMFFRTLFYLPTICGSVIITFIWQWIFNLVPQWLRNDYNITNLNLLSGNNFMISMIIMGVWSGLGTSILLFYSSMKGVDRSLYEAASVDGANSFHKLIHITVPSISPVMFYILFTGILSSFQDFARFQVMASDSSSEYSIMPVWEIYQQVVSGGNLAYGCALGIILGLIIIAISALQFIVSKFWVNYE